MILRVLHGFSTMCCFFGKGLIVRESKQKQSKLKLFLSQIIAYVLRGLT